MNKTLDYDTLCRIAEQARRAKPKRSRRVGSKIMKGRTALVFPALTYEHTSRFQVSYYNDVTAYLERWEVRILNDAHLAGYGLPEEADLADLFGRHIRDHVTPGVRYGLRDQDIYRMAEARAHRALIGWTPGYIEHMAEIGRRGGQTSRRVSPHLDWLRAHTETGATEAARQLGISPRQVHRIRNRLAEETHRAELAELLALVSLPETTRPVSRNEPEPWELEESATVDADPWDLENPPTPFHETTRAGLFTDLPELDAPPADPWDIPAQRAAFEAARVADHAAEFAAFVLELVSAPAPVEPTASIDWDAEMAKLAAERKIARAIDDGMDEVIEAVLWGGLRPADRD